MANIQLLVFRHQWWIPLRWRNYHMYLDNMDLRNPIHSKMIWGSRVDSHQWLNKPTIVAEFILMQLDQTTKRFKEKYTQVKTVDSVWNMDISTIQILMEEDSMPLPKWTLHHKGMFPLRIMVLPTAIKL